MRQKSSVKTVWLRGMLYLPLKQNFHYRFLQPVRSRDQFNSKPGSFIDGIYGTTTNLADVQRQKEEKPEEHHLPTKTRLLVSFISNQIQ